MSTRLKDIAQETGFSINTVSLALNGSTRISEQTRQIIAEAAARLHYVPNKVARSLVTQRSSLVGLVVREMNNIVTNEVATSIEKKLTRLGYNMIFISTTQHTNELDALRILQGQQVDGILMFPSLPPDSRTLNFARNTDMPIIMLSYGDYEMSVDAIHVDKEEAAYVVTKHLLDQGHRRIGFISNSAANDSRQFDCEKFSGYTKALAEYNIRFDPALTVFAYGNTYRAGYDSARYLYRRSNVTAIYGASDMLTCGAMSYYLAHNVRIPEEISFISNDSMEISAYAAVPLSASQYPVEELTERAVQLLMARIDKEPDAPPFPYQYAILPRLDERKSVARCNQAEA